jgi:tetratricopeptide (TPR) repeat protein
MREKLIEGECRNTFLGLALFRQGRFDEAAVCYKEAIAAEAQKKDGKGDKNAWSGLVNVLEAQKKVDEYMEAAMKLAVIYRDL